MRQRRGMLAAIGTLAAAIAALLPASSASAAECIPVKGLNGCVDSDNLWMNAGATPFFSLGPSLTTPAADTRSGSACRTSRSPSACASPPRIPPARPCSSSTTW